MAELQPPRDPQQAAGRRDTDEFYVAALGASAGGLEPLQDFFRRVPRKSGLAYVVVQHLSPKFKSLMPELLARQTDLPIQRVEHGMRIERDHIYLIPAGKEMAVVDRAFQLTDRSTGGLSLPIDIFFSSIAREYGERAIGIVLSGSGTDGTLGIAELQSYSGLTIAQQPSTAAFEAMPASAVSSGHVDWVMPVDEIPEAIARYAANPTSERAVQSGRTIALTPGVDGVIEMLRRVQGVDFTRYKDATVLRRIQRRMIMARDATVDAYRERLLADPEELKALHDDLLIGVTRFFRDSDAFELLQAQLDRLVREAGEREALRIWVAACGSGEEAYTVAMLASEAIRAAHWTGELKVFATDINPASIEAAANGHYPAQIGDQVPPDLLQRYFTRQGEDFQVSKQLRQRIVFARHDLLRDAPFTQIDLVTCRNLLIYLDAVAQRKVISMFHFALRAEGILFLGPSESCGDMSPEFEHLDHHWKLFRKHRDRRLPLQAVTSMSLPRPLDIASGVARARLRREELGTAYDALLDTVVPAGLLLDENGDLVHTFGDATRYLTPPRGPTSVHISDLLPRSMQTPITAAFRRAQKADHPIAFRSVPTSDDNDADRVTITAGALPNKGSQNYVFVTFEPEEAPPVEVEEHDHDEASHHRVRVLEDELQLTRENLQATIEELETSNEELQATNEELVSSNEELQSTNEELHSLNEELHTVNSEYHEKITELSVLTEDMENLLASTEIGTVFLDAELRIRKFTPSIAETFNMRRQDIGRPLEDITHNIRHDDVIEYVKEVLDGGPVVELEVESRDGAPYLLRIHPYRTSGGAREGVVLTFVDIAYLTHVEGERSESEARFLAFVERSPLPAWIADEDARFTWVNEALCRMLEVEEEVVLGRTLDELRVGWTSDDAEDFVERGRRALGGGAPSENVERVERADGQETWLLVTRFSIRGLTGVSVGGLAIDISPRIKAERRVQESRDRLDIALRATGTGIWEWDLVSDAMDWDPDMRTIFGLDPEAVVRGIEAFTASAHPFDARRVREELERVRDGGEPQDLEFRVQRSDGTQRHVATRARVYRTAAGKPHRMVGVVQDVTDTIEAVAKLSEANARLVRVNRELEDFTRAASHDLREPLRKLISFSDLLVEDLGDDLSEDARRDLTAITKAAQRMQDLLDDLLMLSRSGSAPLERESIDLHDCVEAALEQIGTLADREPRIAAGELPEVAGDRTLLTMVYQNLLSNALKFVPDDRLPEVELTAENRDDEWVLGVRDNGIGIDPRHLERVFAPFTRLHNRTEYPGNGIGLSLCQRAISRHGGRIWVESDGNEGCHFRFTLPQTPGESSDLPPLQPPRGRSDG